MKVLVIQPKIGMGDMIIYLPYIHAISKHYKIPVSILVKDNSRARDLLNDDDHIDEILSLDRTKEKSVTFVPRILRFFKFLWEESKEIFETLVPFLP